ncbi:MAG TPA: DUF1707 domain-containing protein [Streptosporangiaceae bacterium]|jgi:hypothetical protein
MADEASAPAPGGEPAPRDERELASREEPVPGSAGLRASHDDRDRAVELLRVAAGDGRITAEELDERVGAALTARTYGELAALIADLPATPGSLPRAPGSPPGAAAKDLVRIECDTSTAHRDGAWLVPRRLEVRVTRGSVTLDFTEAVVSWPSLEIDADIQTGSLILVIAPGILVSTDDLALSTSSVKVDAPWGPEVPVRFRIDVSGRASIGTITARPPRLLRRPRRKFWQWLLRRRPERRALPPGRH